MLGPLFELFVEVGEKISKSVDNRRIGVVVEKMESSFRLQRNINVLVSWVQK